MSALPNSLKEGLKAFTERRNYKSVALFWIGSFLVLNSVISAVSINSFELGIIIPGNASSFLPAFLYYLTGIIGIIILIWNLVYTVKKNMAEELDTSPLLDNSFPVSNILAAELSLGVFYYLLYILFDIANLLSFILVPLLAVYILAAVTYYPFIIIEKGENFIKALRESFYETRGVLKKTDILVSYLILLVMQILLVWSTVSITGTVFSHITQIILAFTGAFIISFGVLSFTELYQSHRKS